MVERHFTSCLLAAVLIAAIVLPAGVRGQTTITSLSDMSSDLTGNYIIRADIDASAFNTSLGTFSGTLEAAIDPDTKMPYRISGLTAPLFATLTGTVKNLVLEGVAISGNSGNTGAIAGEASSAARIYNVGILSGSVGGTGNTGGLVGQLSGTARVVNCYSYATITGGTTVGGIVGNNSVTTTAASINTMVMNCMFYGDITGGTTVSPVYGGTTITNLKHASNRSNDGLNTFNYYAYSKLKSKSIADANYKCALAMEERYLVRFELYRQLLNSNKKLAAFYASTATVTVNLGDMLKWVLETADRSIANPKPYPVLKAQGTYPSIINPDVAHAPDSATVGRNHGGKLPSPRQTLAVTIRTKSQKTNGGQSWPTAAASDVQTTSLTLVRTDKDFDRYNYNYDKVQLPYYNDIGTGNYTEGRVVTGWKITNITGGTEGSYTTSDSWNGYNFADRKCTNKDKYNVSGRVFSQGAYYDVPYGVTAIEIEPYWGNAVYVADEYLDVIYNTNYSEQSVTQLGRNYGTNPTSVTINGSSQNVYTSIANAIGNLPSASTVFDNAMVLVGNLHHYGVISNGTKPFTLMSIDLDGDNEPDYSFIYHGTDRHATCPLRFDFLNVPGTAQAQKPTGADKFCNPSVFNSNGWFEITNTCLIYFSQFEYENNTNKTAPAPIILLGGVYDQFVSTKVSAPKSTTYLHVGGTAWFHDFANGTHSDGSLKTKHIPISVTGGDFEDFHLTGTYNADAQVYADDAECYISGGHFVEAAGAGQEQINGNVRWQIYNADIESFYGGGINDAKPILGTITTEINNSHVGTFCGGPKFGNMASGKRVTTTAVGCTFGKYFGGGYGGNSIGRKKYFDSNKNINWGTLQGYYTADKGKYYDGETTGLGPDNSHLGQYGYKGVGVAVDFDYEFFIWTSGTTGARLFVKFAAFSLAQCNNVSSSLKHCTITGNFYGGGSLGKVADTAYSTLDSCTILGNIYGAGYSATLPQVPVRSGGFTSNPSINKYAGIFADGVFSDTTHYNWKQIESYPANGTQTFTGTNDSIITTTVITKENLGSVRETVLILKGDTKVGTLEGTPGSETLKEGTGDVFGGGEESAVSGNTSVTLEDNTHVYGDVFGGGDQGPVGGSSEVIMKD